MYANQPQIDDFRDCKGYPDAMLNGDKQKLGTKQSYIAEGRDEYGANNDRYSWEAEPILTYILNDRSFLPVHENSAHLASEYDDKFNGTDIVMYLKNKDGEVITLSIDVATSTNYENISNKFNNSMRVHGNTPAMAAYIKYCESDGKKWREPVASHFIIGLMPACLDDAVEKVDIKDGLIAGRNKDPITDFKIVSELYEQAKLQVKLLSQEQPEDEEGRKRVRDLNILGGLLKTRLYKLLGMDLLDNEEEFGKRYQKAMRMTSGDLVYKNIINETARQCNRFSGSKTVKVVKNQ